MRQSQPVVGVVDTSEELTQILSWVAEDAGGQPVVTYVPDLKRGEPDPAVFLQDHDPRVLLWDIGLPYAENWAFFHAVCTSPAGQGRTYILTTTNKGALEDLVGPTSAHEVVGKPFDIDELITTVQQALPAAPATDPPTGADREDAA